MADLISTKDMLTNHMTTCEQMFESASDLSSQNIDDLNDLLESNKQLTMKINSSHNLDGFGLFKTKIELLDEMQKYNSNLTNLLNSLKNRFPKP